MVMNVAGSDDFVGASFQYRSSRLRIGMAQLRFLFIYLMVQVPVI